MSKTRCGLFLLLAVIGVAVPFAGPAAAAPQRVVSLDYCADQFILKLADRDQILALSKDATKNFSYMAKAAEGIPTVASRAEDVLALQPDLVVRSYGGGHNIRGLLQRAGVPMAQLVFSIDFRSVNENAITIAALLGHPERGVALAAEFAARLAALQRPTAPPVETLYLTPGGVTAGPDTPVGRMFAAAGLQPYASSVRAWGPLPLEEMVLRKPELVAAAFFEQRSSRIANWSSARHPVTRRQISDVPLAAIPGATTTCQGWFIADAIEQLAAAGRGVRTQPAPP